MLILHQINIDRQTIDYQLQSSEPGTIDTVTIPEEAKATSDSLLCEVQGAAISRGRIEHNEFVAVPGIHAALLEYGQRRVGFPLANDMTVLGVAEVIAHRDPKYMDLLEGIVDASRTVCERYDRISNKTSL